MHGYVFVGNLIHLWNMVLTLTDMQDNGRTVLFYAVENGMLDLVQQLLDYGADLNITDMVYHTS